MFSLVIRNLVWLYSITFLFAQAKNLRISDNFELSFVPCLNECSGRGSCIDGKCYCKPSFFAEDCSLPLHYGLSKSQSDHLLEPNRSTTCDETKCSKLCIFGGKCIDEFTCLCNSNDYDAVLMKNKKDLNVDLTIGSESKVHKLDSSEKQALIEVMKGLKISMSLFKGDPCLKKWRGVICNRDGHIIEIYFPRESLSGSIIGSNLMQLQFLQFLDLSNNKLIGSIPNSIGKLRSLQSLLLHRNSFTGGIPETIGDCDSLNTLSLYGNRLSGKIPLSVRLLPHMQYFDLSFNELTGEIPNEIGNLISLEALYLNNNKLSGEIPSSLSSLSSLKYLRLENNPKLLGIILPYGNSIVYQDNLNQFIYKGTSQQRFRSTANGKLPPVGALDP